MCESQTKFLRDKLNRQSHTHKIKINLGMYDNQLEFSVSFDILLTPEKLQRSSVKIFLFLVQFNAFNTYTCSVFTETDTNLVFDMKENLRYKKVTDNTIKTFTTTMTGASR